MEHYEAYKSQLTSAIKASQQTLRTSLLLHFLLPHLDRREVEHFWSSSLDRTVKFLSPPVAIRGAEHVFELSDAGDGFRQLR